MTVEHKFDTVEKAKQFEIPANFLGRIWFYSFYCLNPLTPVLVLARPSDWRRQQRRLLL